MAVAVQIARLDDAGEIRHGAKDLRAAVFELEPDTSVDERAALLGRPCLGVIAAIRKQEIGA